MPENNKTDKNKKTVKLPILPKTTIWAWMHQNLFSSPGNSLLTLTGLLFLFWAIPPVVRWAFLDATWLGDARNACDTSASFGKNGACWVFIKVRLDLFIYGFYPEIERWRVDLTFAILFISIWPLLLPDLFKNKIIRAGLFMAGTAVIFYFWGISSTMFALVFFLAPFELSKISFKKAVFRSAFSRSASLALAFTGSLLCAAAVFMIMAKTGGASGAYMAGFTAGLISLPLMLAAPVKEKIWRWIFILTVYPLFAYFMLAGDIFGLAHVETHFWGGLFLTLVIAFSGMATALPIGVILALGRRSEMPAIKMICLFFIELVRGVPLVSVLFMASVMFPLFLPEGAHFDKLLRALIGVSFFYAAYIAEVIRGGLQAIPKGQYEAAQALGWGYSKMMALIILPQVFRIIIPGLTNNILSLFKDTTLVAVIGLLDLLGIAKAAMADAEWLGFTKEAYIFAAIVFWVMCFSISRYCNFLEKKYHSSYQ